MRKFLSGAIAFIAMAVTQAQAADMPVKAAAAAVTRDNAYAGVNLGYSWGRSRTDLTTTANTTQFFSSSFNMDGWLGGVQLGYNWYRSQWMFGLEGDFDLTGQKGSTNAACGAGLCTNTTAVTAPAALASISFEQKLKWLSTVRGRVGPMLNPTSFVYLTGGWAIGRVKTEGTLNSFGAGGAITAPFDNSTTKSGYTLGVGYEGRVSGNLTAKIEYLYVDLGTVSFSSLFPTNAPPLTAAFSSRITDNIVRVGLNYQFR